MLRWLQFKRRSTRLPWYHVLVHGSDHSTYVAEQNLAADEFGEAIDHPMTGYFFADFVDGKYVRNELDG